MKSRFLFAALSVLSLAVSAENLVKNPVFKLEGKSPANWYFARQGDKKALSFSVSQGVLILKNTARNGALFCCQKINALPGKTYTVSFEAKAAAETNANSYVEWVRKNGQYQNNSLSKKRKISAQWQKFQYDLSIPADQLLKDKPYLVFRIRGAGEVSFRNPAVVLQEKNLLKNAAFRESKKDISPWYIVRRGAQELSSFSAANGELTLSSKKGAGIYCCQALSLTPGKSYLVSLEAAGSGSIGGYVEWINKNGDYRNCGLGKGQKAEKSWKKYTFPVVVDADIDLKRQKPYLAVRVKDAGTVSFRNIKIVRRISYDTIVNPRFEKADGWIFTRSSYIDKSGGYANTGTLVLKGKGAEAAQKNMTLSGGLYRLTFSVSGKENMTSVNGFSEFGCAVTDLRGKKLAEIPKNDCFNNAWQSKELVFSVPPGTVISFSCRSFSDGLICLDNFRLEKIRKGEIKPITVQLDSPYYRNMIFSTDPVKEIAGNIRTSKEVKSIQVSFGADGRQLAFPIRKGICSFSIPAGKLAIGKHPLKIQALLKNGKTYKETILIEKLPPGKNEMIVVKGNTFRFNGRPFVPLNESVPLFDEHPGGAVYMRSMGVGTTRWSALPPGKMIRDQIKYAEKHGLRYFIQIPLHHLYNTNQESGKFQKVWKEWLKAITPEMKNSPALNGYFALDEPLWNGIPLETVKQCYEDLKAHDPYHPVFYCEAPRGMPDDWRPYARYCDVFAIDVYPIPESANHSELPEKGVRSVGEYTLLARQTVDDRKPVRMALQAFAWGVHSAQRKFIYPTKTQLRFMYFDAFLHGAKTIGYYSNTLNSKKVCREVFDCAVEIRLTAPVFLYGRELPLSVSDKNILAKLFEYKGHKYLIASNRSEQKCSVEFSLPGGKYHVLSEKRVVSSRSGKLRETFAPWQVHIYSTSGTYPEGTLKLTAKEEKLLDEFIELRTNKLNAFKGHANWIWSPGNEKTVVFTRKFTNDGSLKKARLQITADDYFTAYINGKKVTSGARWDFFKSTDVTDKLCRGENVITVEAGNWSGACGLLAHLELTGSKGSKTQIITDNSWQTAPAGKSSKTAPAKVIFPLGKGPWRF